MEGTLGLGVYLVKGCVGRSLRHLAGEEEGLWT